MTLWGNKTSRFGVGSVYCNNTNNTALWSKFNVGILNKLLSSYNWCIKIFFGFNRRDSLTNILVTLGLPSFDTVMANATMSYSRL